MIILDIILLLSILSFAAVLLYINRAVIVRRDRRREYRVWLILELERLINLAPCDDIRQQIGALFTIYETEYAGKNTIQDAVVKTLMQRFIEKYEKQEQEEMAF